MQKLEGAEARVDGRRVRGQNNRVRIVDALLRLVANGNVAPSAEDVSSEAGVALRTVFRHFADMESLYREISARMRAEIAPIVARPFQAPEGHARLRDLVERRAIVFERLMPFKLASDVHRHASAFLSAEHSASVKLLRKSLIAALPNAVQRRRELVAVLEALLSFETWRRLRLDQKLKAREAKATLRFAIERLLSGAT